ncbi:MAG: TIGR03668 family PPOX class F420-dependent oxidoreductase [Actinomycetota bacterium]|jgi:PPOX class probable F420-dependent enzyme|nr:TIGR03668 family PPOX class F420-dependent oxidoreductase [Actinomycetota bacterium]MED5553025.1 TIGR03668 family PPOX class F420-dependent oxidoreductase [Actinomycetota bacterium]MEE3186394.1 TIGR03668 family PPOX class F420-dependent oxidoreductase [Actinomycetota bacterium]HJM21041.1 TIGR03668 family PPOX class F420-dependent oxidoreductase [Acidimicrobiales bacterium]|tara:strand:+ start:233 stop:643 length:411 start_codon:yes stop_codon:yes gene_type:complete
MNESELLELLDHARVATLATIRADGRVDLVPITFAFDEQVVVTAIDHKRKSTTELKRLDNIRQFPEVTLLVDHYDDQDWNRLWWVRVRGRAKVHQTGSEYERALDLLADRYNQYAKTRPKGAAIIIDRTELTGWKA